MKIIIFFKIKKTLNIIILKKCANKKRNSTNKMRLVNLFGCKADKGGRLTLKFEPCQVLVHNFPREQSWIAF